MEFVNRALSLLQKTKRVIRVVSYKGCFLQATEAMLMDSVQSVSHGESEEFGWVDGSRGQIGNLVILFGHTKGPRTGFPQPPLYYSHGLDTVPGRAAGPSFVLSKWHFLLLTLAVDPRFLVDDLETSSLAEISIPWEMLIKFTCEFYCVDNLKSLSVT